MSVDGGKSRRAAAGGGPRHRATPRHRQPPARPSAAELVSRSVRLLAGPVTGRPEAVAGRPEGVPEPDAGRDVPPMPPVPPAPGVPSAPAIPGDRLDPELLARSAAGALYGTGARGPGGPGGEADRPGSQGHAPRHGRPDATGLDGPAPDDARLNGHVRDGSRVNSRRTPGHRLDGPDPGRSSTAGTDLDGLRDVLDRYALRRSRVGGDRVGGDETGLRAPGLADLPPDAPGRRRADRSAPGRRATDSAPERAPDDWVPGGRAAGPPSTGRPARAGTRRASRHGATRARRPMPFWQEFPLLVLVAFSLALLIKTFFLQAFFIPSGSMENTLKIRDRVLVNKIVYDLRDPRRGEVLVFRGTDSWAPEASPPRADGLLASVGRSLGSAVGLSEPDEKDFIKRVIGLPGDVVRCCDGQGRVLVNGHPLDEPYVFDDTPPDGRTFGPVTVPAGRLFVLGDHRKVSADSREYLSDQWQGTVPIDQVIGRAVVTVWPAGRWESLPVPETFDDVPEPAARPTSLGPTGPAMPSASSAPPAPPAPPAPQPGPAVLAILLLTARGALRPRRDGRVRRAPPRTLRG